MTVIPYVYFITTECTIVKVLAQHVSNVTASIIRSTTETKKTYGCKRKLDYSCAPDDIRNMLS
jgi:hypothetical protein